MAPGGLQPPVLRSHATAPRAGAVAQPGVGAPAARHRRRLHGGISRALRLRSAKTAAQSLARARHRLGHADADDLGVRGLCQRRLSHRALLYRAHRGHESQGAGAGNSRHRGDDNGEPRSARGAAGAEPGNQLPRHQHDARRHSRGYRQGRARTRAQGPRRQDRHHQRIPRRLVLGLQRGFDRDRLAWLRPAGPTRARRNRRARGAADLDGLHARGA